MTAVCATAQTWEKFLDISTHSYKRGADECLLLFFHSAVMVNTMYVCTYVAFCNTSLGTDDEDSEPNGRALIASHNYLHKVCT